MTEEDDKTWLEVLAGRAPDNPHPPAAREAQLLRDSIARRRQTQQAKLPAQDSRREAELIARARREGLINFRPRVRPAVALAYAAAIAFVSIGLFLLLQPSDQQEIVRGSHDGIVTVEAANPVALRDRISSELRAVGISATAYERLGMQGLDADLPQPISAPVREILDKHHLPVPADGVLKIEITTPSTR